MMMNPIRRSFRIFALVTFLSLIHVSPARGGVLPDSAYITGVSGHSQGYSLSCESRSAADLAAFWGINISEMEFLQALPHADNPDKGFVGNPGDAWGNLPPLGYGVHADPVAQTLHAFGLEAKAYRDLSWDDLREEIDAGHPVIVWVIGQMWGGTPVEYHAPDGSTARVAAYEHTMLLIGYSPDSVQVVDAYSGLYQTYWLRSFLKSWAVLGNMAVFGSSPDLINHDVSSETHADSYTVQFGDYLVALADRFSSTWQELAQLNSIGYPYTIFPGQVLKLPVDELQESDVQLKIEPEAVESPPVIREVNFQVRLPLVLHNFTASVTPPLVSAPLSNEPVDSVTVQSSNTLVNFSKSIGIDWHVLVELNKLQPPYMVHPGQVLKVK